MYVIPIGFSHLEYNGQSDRQKIKVEFKILYYAPTNNILSANINYDFNANDMIKVLDS